MKLSISADIGLTDPGLDGEHVTWLDVRARDRSDQTSVSARAALVHIGEIADAHGDIRLALRGSELDAIHDVYFSQGWYRDEYADGAGIDLLYVSGVVVEQGWGGRNVDLAVVRRLCDTMGSGAQLVVMPYRDAHEAAHWSRLGFQISTPGRSSGLMHMKLAYRHARVVDTTGAGHFDVLSTGELPAGPFVDRLTQN